MTHDDQIDLRTDVARDLIRAQFPQFRGQPIERLDGPGTVNAVFRIGSQAAARFPLRAGDPLEAAATLRREAAAMTELARHCPFPTPRPVGLGRPGPGHPMPWAVQTWIPGDVATPDGLAASHTLALDLVTLVASLRAAGTDGRRFDGQGRGGKLSDHDAWMAVCFENSEGLLDVPRFRGLWARLRELPPSGPEVMSHRDLIPANLLVRDGHLAGVLDGGSFGPADPALDLVAAWHLLDRAARGTVRSRLGSGDVEWRRGAAWAFQQAMGLVWYYRRTNPAMSALGCSTLRRILEARRSELHRRAAPQSVCMVRWSSFSRPFAAPPAAPGSHLRATESVRIQLVNIYRPEVPAAQRRAAKGLVGSDAHAPGCRKDPASPPDADDAAPTGSAGPRRR